MAEASVAPTADVALTARRYRAIWRDCVIAGSFGLLTVTPLISAAVVEIESASGGPQGSGVRDALASGAAPGTWLAWTVIAISLACVFCTGRFSPRRVVPATVLLIAGACLVAADNRAVIVDAVKSGRWDIADLYTAFEAGVWALCAIDAAVALALLAVARAASGRPLMLTEMASFERFGRRRRSTHRTYRVSRLLWLVVGLAATFAMTLALQVANGVLLRQLVLAIPKDLHRNADANREFVLSHPTIAVLAALADLVQIVLTVVLATVIMRFFWRLVVADARRLLEDPGYRPVVFCAPSRTTRRPSSPSVCSIGSSGAAAGSRRLRPPHSSRSERQSPSASPASNCHSSARSVPTIPMTPGRRPCSPGCSAPS